MNDRRVYEELVWTLHCEYYPYPPEMLWQSLGLIPSFLDPRSRRSAVEQFRDNHQGVWDDMKGFVLLDGVSLKYPGDPPMHPVATCEFRDELVLVYPFGWVCVKRPDRSFEVARLD